MRVAANGPAEAPLPVRAWWTMATNCSVFIECGADVEIGEVKITRGWDGVHIQN